MSLSIETIKGWTEVVLDGNCGYEKFYNAARILHEEFNIWFLSKLDDFDTLYWDFRYRDSLLCLHYNIYFGLSVFPRAFKLATVTDNERVIEIGELLYEKLSSWNKNAIE
jgi:hypothetical protein